LVLVTVGAGRQKTKKPNAKRKPRKQAKRSKPKRETGASRGPGRPRTPVDLEKAALLASYGMREPQIAAKLGISTSKLQRLKKEDPQFAETFGQAVEGGTGDYETDIQIALFKSAKRGDKGALLWAAEQIKNKYREGPQERPLLLEVPLADGSCLYVPEGMDPITAAEHAENIFKLPPWEFPTRDDLEKAKG